MADKSNFSRDCGRLYLRYIIGGAAAIPAGIVYGFIATHGNERWWTGIVVIALGLASAATVWRFVEPRLFGGTSSQPTPQEPPAPTPRRIPV